MQESYTPDQLDVQRRYRLINNALNIGTIAAGVAMGVGVSFLPETESLADQAAVAGGLIFDGVVAASFVNFVRNDRTQSQTKA